MENSGEKSVGRPAESGKGKTCLPTMRFELNQDHFEKRIEYNIC